MIYKAGGALIREGKVVRSIHMLYSYMQIYILVYILDVYKNCSTGYARRRHYN